MHKGRWGLFFDAVYSETSGKDQTALGEVKLNNSLFIMELGAIFRVTHWSSDNSQQPPGAFELISGVRYWDIENEISFSNIEKREKTADWTDPFIGDRMFIPLSERFILTLRGDVGGGYRIGFQLERGLLCYEFTEMISIWAGYRALGVEWLLHVSILQNTVFT